MIGSADGRRSTTIQTTAASITKRTDQTKRELQQVCFLTRVRCHLVCQYYCYAYMQRLGPSCTAFWRNAVQRARKFPGLCFRAIITIRCANSFLSGVPIAPLLI
jgi:hypothetical protein